MRFALPHLLLQMVTGFRVVWLRGRYGSGKTLFAHALASELLHSGQFRYLVSNIDSVWNINPDAVELDDMGRANAVLLLDEAGEFISTRSEAKSWLSALRKLNTVVISASVLPPAPDMRTIEIKRIWDGGVIGLPVWRYQYTVDNDFTEKFNFWNPEKLYGIYDTIAFPTDADVILASFQAWLKRGGVLRSTRYNPFASVVSEAYDRIAAVDYEKTVK